MTMNHVLSWRAVLAAAFALWAAGGCSSLKDPYPAKALFAIEPGTPGVSEAARAGAESATRPAAGVLRVRALRVLPPYDGANFVYRTGPSQFDTDYYNNFVAPPAAMLTGSLVAWLDRVGPMRAVDTSSSLHPDAVLEGEVTGLYVDSTDKAHPRAVIAARFFLLRERESDTRIVFDRTYEADGLAAASAPGAFATAWGRAWREVLVRLTNDFTAATEAR